jgi:thiol-disulfide isomerase/thioredoxin
MFIRSWAWRITHGPLVVFYAVVALLVPFAAVPVAPGEPVPPLAAPLEDGTLLQIQDYRGQVVYLDFWASWCPPCRQAMPVLDRLHRQWQGQGFTVVGVNVDTRRGDALRMLERVPVSFPIVYDPQGEWAQTFALTGMPSGYLVDRKGVVRYVHAGYQSKDLPKLTEQIQAVLRETP